MPRTEKPKEKSRTLYYRRAIWIKNNSQTLEAHLDDARTRVQTTRDRSFAYGESTGQVQGLKIEKLDIGIFCHVASYIPDEQTSLVPKPSIDKEVNTSTQDPPDNHNFMHGDIFFLVAGDHLLICPSGARESVAVAFIENILRAAGLEKIVPKFNIQAVTNLDKIRMIEREGVKSIGLNSTIYEATLDYEERKLAEERQTKMLQILGGTVGEIFKALGKDQKEALPQVSDMENLSVRVQVSYDGRKKGGHLGRETLEETAKMIAEDEDDHGFTITTGMDNKVKANEVRVSQKVLLTPNGNSVFRSDARQALENYYHKLKSSGTLEQ